MCKVGNGLFVYYRAVRILVSVSTSKYSILNIGMMCLQKGRYGCEVTKLITCLTCNFFIIIQLVTCVHLMDNSVTVS